MVGGDQSIGPLSVFCKSSSFMLAGAAIMAKMVAVVLMLMLALMRKGAGVCIAVNATAGSAQSRRPWP
jgi:hypothetical protein